MVRRMVARESTKCLSGRARERTGFIRPSGRGGKSSGTFGHEEGVRTEDGGDVVMPAGEAAPLEVIEPQFALELLVDLLGAVALLEEAYDLLLRHPSGERGEEVAGGLVLADGPLDQEPLLDRLKCRLARCLHSAEGEPGGELPPRPLPPGTSTKRLGPQRERDLLGRARVAPTLAAPIQGPHRVGRVNGHAVVEAEQAHGLAEGSAVTVERVREDDRPGDLVERGLLDHAEREVVLRLEDRVRRDPGLLPSLGVLRPRLGQEQREVDREVLRGRRNAQAHRHLAVGRLAGRPRVLTLHTGRVLPLLEEACVVDDPGHHRFTLLHRGDGVPRRREADLVVVPRRVRDEVVDPLVARARVLRVARGARRDRLHALPLRLAQQTHRVHRERFAAVTAAEQLADPVEVPFKPTLASGFHLVRHAPVSSCRGPACRTDLYMITYDHIGSRMALSQRPRAPPDTVVVEREQGKLQGPTNEQLISRVSLDKLFEELAVWMMEEST